VKGKLQSFIVRFGERNILIGIVLLAFICELIAMPTPSFFGEPYLIAKHIVAGEGFIFLYPVTNLEGPTCYVTPLFAYIQAGVLFLGLGERGIQVLNLLFLQVSCFVLYRFFRNFTSPNIAIVIFAALSFYVPFWVLSYTLEPNTLNLLLLAMTVDRLYHISKFPSRKLWLQFGALIGFQLLLRPDIILGFVLFVAWVFLSISPSLRRRVPGGGFLKTAKGLGIAVLIALAIVSPWTIRNYLTFHRFVLVSANSGMNLFEGNNPVATGEFSENTPTDESRRDFAAILDYSKSHDQIEVDQYRLKLSEEWILAHPAEILALDMKKVWWHWYGRSIIGEQFHYKYQAFAIPFRIITVLMLLLAFYGLFTLRDRKLRSLLITVFIYSTLVSAIFFVQTRHRILKCDPFLLPLAVIGVVSATRTFSSRHSERSEESLTGAFL
jgi:hypothetical protein